METSEARLSVELLTTVKSVGADGVPRTRCFGNILELGRKSLVLECNRGLSFGERLTLSLVFPGQRGGGNPMVSMGCVVHRVRDDAKLQYELSIREMDEAGRDRLGRYLAEPARNAQT